MCVGDTPWHILEERRDLCLDPERLVGGTHLGLVLGTCLLRQDEPILIFLGKQLDRSGNGG